jgi:hypothetical protein
MFEGEFRRDTCIQSWHRQAHQYTTLSRTSNPYVMADDSHHCWMGRGCLSLLMGTASVD